MTKKRTGDGMALYRKYRPQTFDDVVGQDQVVKVLQSSIKDGSVAHAYLFAGSRGTGKTSVARIFARDIGTSANDLYEIDAASNRGIDDVREIKMSVNTLPFDSAYKVYIIDEAHMLTKDAFNALLKTLEEPPAHAIFILATTEMHKLPETVISRCQTFQFRKPNASMLKDVALDVGGKEGYAVDPSAAELVALLGDGSFRDTLGILQKVISSVDGKKVSVEDVESVTGAPRSELVNSLVASIADRKLEDGLAAINSASEGNVDMKMYLSLVLQKMRYALLLRFAPGLKERIVSELSETDFAFVSKLAERKDANISSQALLELLSARGAVGDGRIPELPLELSLVRMLGKEE